MITSSDIAKNVSDLVSSHLKFQNQTNLKMSIGDGYLYVKNPIFRKIREQVTILGGKFTDRVNLKNYLICPHLSYNEISKYRQIPFIKNASALFEIQKLQENLPIHKIIEIKKNKILHESAHLYANSIVFKNFSRSDSIENEKEFVFLSLISESFASACETIGQIYISDSIYRWIYKQNSNDFGCECNNYHQLLITISKKFGNRFLFNIALWSFFFWNNRHTNIASSKIIQIASFFFPSNSLTTEDKSIIIEFSKYHFLVKNRFRNEVANLYFYTAGIKTSIADLLLKESKNYFKIVSKLEWKVQSLLKIIPEK